MRIEKSDIEKLIKEPSPQVRSAISSKVCKGYAAGAFSKREADLSEQIIRLLLKDTSLRVRQTLSNELKSAGHVPRDIIIALANDHESVAEDVLRHSPVLSEDDLIAIVEATHNVRRLLAIASRENMSGELSYALIQSGEHIVTKTVIQNPGSRLDDDSLSFLLEEYYQDDSILELLVYRGGLPHRVAETLFAHVSEQYKRELTRRYRLNRRTAQDVARNAREISLMQFISPSMTQRDIETLIEEMNRNGRLTDSCILRSLCIGDLRFFETAIAKRAGLNIANARLLLSDPGSNGFNACYETAGLSPNYRDAVRTIFRIAQEETSFGQYQNQQFVERVIERVVESGQDQIDNMSYLLTILGKAAQHDSTVH